MYTAGVFPPAAEYRVGLSRSEGRGVSNWLSEIRRRHIFDSHTHYDDVRYEEDPSIPSRDELLQTLFEQEVKLILNAGTNLDSSRKSLALAEKYPGCMLR